MGDTNVCIHTCLLYTFTLLAAVGNFVTSLAFLCIYITFVILHFLCSSEISFSTLFTCLDSATWGVTVELFIAALYKGHTTAPPLGIPETWWGRLVLLKCSVLIWIVPGWKSTNIFPHFFWTTHLLVCLIFEPLLCFSHKIGRWS